MHREASVVAVAIGAATRTTIGAVRTHGIGVLVLKGPSVRGEWASRLGGDLYQQDFGIKIILLDSIVDNLRSTNCSSRDRSTEVIGGDVIARCVFGHFIIVLEADIWWPVPTASGGILCSADIAPAMLSSGLPAIGVALWVETIEKRLNICH